MPTHVVGEGKPEYKPSFAVVVIVSASTRYGIEYSDSKLGTDEGSNPLPSALTISATPLPGTGFWFARLKFVYPLLLPFDDTRRHRKRT
jgi:hypothetical protein